MKDTQQKILLALLQENPVVNSYDITYKHSIKQGPTRIKELREMGYNIVSTPLKNRSVDYCLISGLSTSLPKSMTLKIEPEGANLASDKKNPNKGRFLYVYDQYGNMETVQL